MLTKPIFSLMPKTLIMHFKVANSAKQPPHDAEEFRQRSEKQRLQQHLHEIRQIVEAVKCYLLDHGVPTTRENDRPPEHLGEDSRVHTFMKVLVEVDARRVSEQGEGGQAMKVEGGVKLSKVDLPRDVMQELSLTVVERQAELDEFEGIDVAPYVVVDLLRNYA